MRYIEVVESIGHDKPSTAIPRGKNTGEGDILVETRNLKRTKQFRQTFLYHVIKTVRPFGDINGKQINILKPYIIELLYVNLDVLETTLEQVSYK